MRHICALSILCLAVTSVPALAGPSVRPAAPAGSFLRHEARSVRQLLDEVRTDTGVRHRLARYFQQPDDRIGGYLVRTLHTAVLSRRGDYTVYFVAGSGLVYPTRMALGPGTPVFVTRTGRPLLLQGTGDPLKPFATAIEIMTIPASPIVGVAGTQEEVLTTAPVDIPVPVTPAGVPGVQSASAGSH